MTSETFKAKLDSEIIAKRLNEMRTENDIAVRKSAIRASFDLPVSRSTKVWLYLERDFGFINSGQTIVVPASKEVLEQKNKETKEEQERIQKESEEQRKKAIEDRKKKIGGILDE